MSESKGKIEKLEKFYVGECEELHAINILVEKINEIIKRLEI
jgi:hypothetical protein